VSTAEALAKPGVENGRALCYISNRVLISVICFSYVISDRRGLTDIASISMKLRFLIVVLEHGL
jgi:hypothetical protein